MATYLMTIETKIRQATTYRGTRIFAHMDKTMKTTVPYDYDLDLADNHRKAADTLIETHMPRLRIKDGGHTVTGMVWVVEFTTLTPLIGIDDKS